MTNTTALIVVALALGAPSAHAQTSKDIRFYSEAVSLYGKVFFPSGFSTSGSAPAVILAPDWGEMASTTEKYAAQFAARGIVVMTIDYRGWGKSGGFIYLADATRWDDRLRFSQHTSKVRIRRQRLLPDAQLIDLRNAITFIQGEPGVDPARIGVWGVGVSGGHVVALAALDARVKAGVAQTPIIPGKDVPRQAFSPTAAQRASMVRLARTGQAPATPAAAVTMNDQEAQLALAEYQPFTLLDQIPTTTAILFVVAEKDAVVDNEAHAVPASRRLAGPASVTAIPGSTHAMPGKAADAAADAAADWFAKHL